jgi:hypothetical protein
MTPKKFELDYVLANESVMLYHNENLNKLIIAEKENLNHFSCKALMLPRTVFP